jgi:hypothetical protein
MYHYVRLVIGVVCNIRLLVRLLFVQTFVSKTCRSIIDDVEKLDSIQDGFVHYEILRFYQVTRLHYHSIMLLTSIFYSVIFPFFRTNTLIVKLLTRSSQRELSNTQMVGTCRVTMSGHTWVRHIPHTGGFGVTFNDITKDVVIHTNTSRFVSWSSFIVYYKSIKREIKI